jgi:hypothetical protein
MPRYRIVIFEVDPEKSDLELGKIYEQTVPEIDLRAVMAGVNKRPRKSRAKGAQSGAAEPAK